MIPMVWRLASRLAKMESLDESRAQDTREKLENIEQELNLIRESREKAADVERQGRKELWVEVSALRERLVKIETKMGDQS
jgi:TPP-dependent pyruvate/acetoin dehydrogenase alpha subunit